MMNLIAFIASFVFFFVIFAKVGWFAWKAKTTVMGFGTFFFRISKFIWGMSLADRTIIWNKLQVLVRNIILRICIQDSRFKAQKKLLQSHLVGFKIQDSRLRKTSSIQPLWIQDSKFKAQKKLLQSHLFGLKIQYSRLKAFGFKKFFWDLESWILNPTPLDSRSLFGILSLESWILPPWIQEVFFWDLEILSLESYPLGFKKSFWNLESWIVPLGFKTSFLGSWILNPTPLDSRGLFGSLNLESWILPSWIQEVFWEILNLESWILDPMYLGKGGMGTKLQKKCNFWSPENALSFRVQHAKKNCVNTMKFAWNVGLGGVPYIYIYVTNTYIYVSWL